MLLACQASDTTYIVTLRSKLGHQDSQEHCLKAKMQLYSLLLDRYSLDLSSRCLSERASLCLSCFCLSSFTLVSGSILLSFLTASFARGSWLEAVPRWTISSWFTAVLEASWLAFSFCFAAIFSSESGSQYNLGLVSVVLNNSSNVASFAWKTESPVIKNISCQSIGLAHIKRFGFKDWAPSEGKSWPFCKQFFLSALYSRTLQVTRFNLWHAAISKLQSSQTWPRHEVEILQGGKKAPSLYLDWLCLGLFGVWLLVNLQNNLSLNKTQAWDFEGQMVRSQIVILWKSAKSVNAVFCPQLVSGNIVPSRKRR